MKKLGIAIFIVIVINLVIILLAYFVQIELSTDSKITLMALVALLGLALLGISQGDDDTFNLN
jgi:hypothetical protein